MYQIASYLLIAKMTISAMSRRIIGIMMPTRKVVLSGSVVISADHLDSLKISLVVYARILNLNVDLIELEFLGYTQKKFLFIHNHV